MEPQTESYLKSRIAALEQDIEMFGPAGDDLVRLAHYRKQLADLQSLSKSDG
jgi:hypothetical protein